jgi:hypothetical protein
MQASGCSCLEPSVVITLAATQRNLFTLYPWQVEIEWLRLARRTALDVHE